MVPRTSGPLLLLLLNFWAATALAYPTWWLAVFQYRCKAPYIVEATCDGWGEWRVSSICAPGTCCSMNAATGPLCSADACEAADAERARLMEAKNAADAAAKKLKQQQEKPKTRQELLAIDQNAEAEWKKKEAREAKKKLRKKRKAQKAKTLSELAQEQVGGDVLV